MPNTLFLYRSIFMEYQKLDSSDIGDQATALEELNLRVALENQKLAALNQLKPRLVEKKKNGKLVQVHTCLYCHEELEDGERFCDSDCRDDWQKEQNMRKITGK